MMSIWNEMTLAGVINLDQPILLTTLNGYSSCINETLMNPQLDIYLLWIELVQRS